MNEELIKDGRIEADMPLYLGCVGDSPIERRCRVIIDFGAPSFFCYWTNGEGVLDADIQAPLHCNEAAVVDIVRKMVEMVVKLHLVTMLNFLAHAKPNFRTFFSFLIGLVGKAFMQELGTVKQLMMTLSPQLLIAEAQ